MHYSILAILRKGENLDQVMEPFYDELEVDEYEEECWCVGDKAREDVNKAYGFLKNVREVYDALPEEKQTNSLWRKMLEAHRVKEKELLEAHPDIAKANPKCEECKGSGVVKSTHNPNGNWDYYTEGGRWDGSLMNKKGKTVNKLKVKNLSLEQMELAVHKELVDQWDKIQEAIEKNTPPHILERELGYLGEKDFQTYAAKRKPDSVSAYAYVVDGKWVAHKDWDRKLRQSKPIENWQEGLDEVIKKADPNDTLIMVDCHN